MTRIIIVTLLLILSHGLGGAADIPWPKKLKELSLKDGATTISGFKITAKASSLQDGHWRNGPVLDITVKNLKTDEIHSFTYTSVGIAILDFYHGWPQLEIWDQCGEGVYNRDLTRFEKSDYQNIRTDTFTLYQDDAKDTSITTTMPHGDDTLYFIETRIPEVFPRK